MGYSNINEVIRDLWKVISSKLIKRISGVVKGSILKYKIWLNKEIYIQIYYNEVASTTAYALIWGNRRIFGIDYDKIRGWHEHPLENPDEHRPCKQTKLTEFLEKVEKNLQKNTQKLMTIFKLANMC